MGRGPYGKTKMQVFVTGASGFIPQVRVAISRLIERIKATPRQPGVDDIRIPSERAFRSRERALRAGLEIDRVVFDALVALRAR
jgi:LDH2 family malate/lactate/ureidoglycolate dehydrogenase